MANGTQVENVNDYISTIVLPNDSKTYYIKDAEARTGLNSKIDNPSTKQSGQYLKYNGTNWVADSVIAGISDVKYDGTSVVTSGVANIPKEIYWCTSTTTKVNVTEAVSQGKLPIYKHINNTPREGSEIVDHDITYFIYARTNKNGGATPEAVLNHIFISFEQSADRGTVGAYKVYKIILDDTFEDPIIQTTIIQDFKLSQEIPTKSSGAFDPRTGYYLSEQGTYDFVETYLNSIMEELLEVVELNENKVTSWSSTTTDTNYPSEKLVKDSLDLKADASTLTSHTGNTSNPHSVTKAQVGLSNVNNTGITANDSSGSSQGNLQSINFNDGTNNYKYSIPQGTYSKPSGGIPASDLAETYYLASNPNGYTSNTGTVTSVAVKMNGATKGTVTTSGEIDLGTVITAHQDISGKEDKSNKKSAWTGTTGNDYYPTEKLVKTELDNVRAVAEGKTKSYVIEHQNNITGTKGADDNYTNVTAITGVTLSNLKIGDVILIKDTDVPDYWVSQISPSVSLNKMETSKVPLNEYVSKNEAGDLAYKDNASGSFTPSGTVGTPTITVTPSTTTVNSITAVGTLPTHANDTFTQGTLPTWSASVTSEVLSFSFGQGTLPTFTQGTFTQGTLPTKSSNQTVMTGASATSSQPTFTGTSATITVE